jgi:hypothetical protein
MLVCVKAVWPSTKGFVCSRGEHYVMESSQQELCQYGVGRKYISEILQLIAIFDVSVAIVLSCISPSVF